LGTKTRFGCEACGNVFIATVGDGLFSRTLHCDRCGVEKVIAKKAATKERIMHVCGGSFMNTGILCPKCRSDRIVPLGALGHFD